MKKRMIYCVTSFAASSVILFLIFFFLKAILNDFTLFVGDSLVQYLPFINSFVNDLVNGDTIWYSFSNYLGSGNILTVVYYCLSPFNILFYICGDNFILAYDLIIILKISLASASFCYFICSFMKKERLYYIATSLFYGLSGYIIVMFFNIMWLDAMYILPVLIWLIIKYVEKKSYIALIITYAYLFLTNFYMSYMVGVFSAVFFIMYFWYASDFRLKGNVKKFLLSGLGFAGVVILAAGLGAFLLLSTAGFMTEHMASDNFDFQPLVASIPDFVNSMFIGEFMTMNNMTPLLYCGLPTVALIFYFFISKNINSKSKVFYGIQLSFFVLCMGLMPLYEFMHAFDYPNFYGFRFSFIIIFLALMMSCEALEKVDVKSMGFFVKISIVGIVFYSIMMTYQKVNFPNVRLNNQNGLAINALFIMVWLGLAYLYTNNKAYNYERNKTEDDKNTKYRWLYVLTSIVVIAELIVNGVLCIKYNDFGLTEKNGILEWYYAEKDAVSRLKSKDGGFYRVYVNNETVINSAKMFDYNSMTTFSSSDNYRLRMTLNRLGLATSNRYVRTSCDIPVFNSLFAVNYEIRIPNYSDYSELKVGPDNYLECEIVENEYPLSLGYMVSRDILNYEFKANSFDNLENLCNAMTGQKRDVYETIGVSEDNIYLVNYNMNREGQKYIFTGVSKFADEPLVAVSFPKEMDDTYIEFFYESPMSYMYFPSVLTIEMGTSEAKYVSEGGINLMTKTDGVTLADIVCTGEPLEFFIDRINAARYNKDEFEPVYEELSKNQFEIIQNDEDIIVGKVVATEDKPLLFLSVPYETEWKVYVDGKPCDSLYSVLGDAFMAIELTPGEHTIAMQYIEKWSAEGAMISLASMILFCGLVLLNIVSKNKKNQSVVDTFEDIDETNHVKTMNTESNNDITVKEDDEEGGENE